MLTEDTLSDLNETTSPAALEDEEEPKIQVGGD
jgi:MutS domain III